jgi:hypothetical protein
MEQREKPTDIKGGPPHLQPAVSRRPFGANRFIVFSPKAKRRLDLFGIAQLHLWLRLEADPATKQLCERPVVIQDNKRPRAVDFWVTGPGLNKYLLIARGSVPLSASTEPRFPAFRAWAKEVGCEVEEIQTLENSPGQENWYGNWTTIIQQISNYGPYINSKLTEQLRIVSTHRIEISELLNQFPKEEPDLVRATIFELVHQGQLRFIDLRKDRLSDLSEVEPS